MRRGLIAVDRIDALAIALIAIAAGATAVAWHQGLVPDAPDRIEFDGLTKLPELSWWPWATGAGGLLLVGLGLSWLARHLPRRGTGLLNLPGSDDTGRLTADANAAATAAGRVLAQTRGVRDGSGRILRDRGQLVAELTATLEPDAALPAITEAARRTADELQHVIGRDDLRHRVLLRVARTGKTATTRRVL